MAQRHQRWRRVQTLINRRNVLVDVEHVRCVCVRAMRRGVWNVGVVRLCFLSIVSASVLSSLLRRWIRWACDRPALQKLDPGVCVPIYWHMDG
eukprot:7947451-Alexandrium_andersonii.AAC.1